MRQKKVFFMSQLSQVVINLQHFHLWSNVGSEPIRTSNKEITHVIKGVPPKELPGGETDTAEWILPIDISTKITLCHLDEAFSGIKSLCSTRPKRILIAIVNTDGTVVYYFIHDGIVKPRRT